MVGTYNGNLRGNIKYVDPSAKPIGETPLPVGFDANDMPTFAEGSFSKLGPGNEWIK